MERDDSEPGSGLAEWPELVARLESPTPSGPGPVPWPDAENVGPPAAGPGPGAPAPGTGSPARRLPGGLGRVIRPAGFTSFAVPRDPAASREPAAPGRPPAAAGDAPAPREPAARGRAGTGPGPGPAGPGRPEEGANGFDDELEQLYDLDELGDRYIPPLVPRQPGLDPVARGAWAALFGGPGYLFLATVLNWRLPGWAELAAVMAFVTGFVVLVARLGDGPSRRDGPDQGAVV